MKIGSNEEGVGTVVGANVRLQGTLKDTNDINVYGTVEGEVISDKNVIIAETAMIKGPVSADIVIISGEVKGSIEVKSKLEITATGKVNGSIACKTLIVHAGAKLNGKSSMEEESTSQKSEEKTAKEEKNDNFKADSNSENPLENTDIEIE